MKGLAPVKDPDPSQPPATSYRQASRSNRRCGAWAQHKVHTRTEVWA